MVTKEKLEIYRHYGGDIDGWERLSLANETQKTIINADDWSAIDSLLQNLILMEKGLVSDSFAKAVNEELQAKCDCEDTIRILKELAAS